jgi:hypothetical protein
MAVALFWGGALAGGFFFLGAVAVPSGFVWYMFRRDRLYRARLMDNCGPGTLFVGKAFPVTKRVRRLGAAPSRQVVFEAGLLIVDGHGLAFLNSQDPTATPEMSLRWDDITNVAGRQRGMDAAFVEVTASTAATFEWLVIGAIPGRLERALQDLATAREH